MSAPTRINIDGGTVGAPVHVLVGDRLVLIYDGGAVEDMRSLRTEIEAARACRTAINVLGRLLTDLRAAGERGDGHGGTDAKRREAFAAGLEAALVQGDTGREIQTSISGAFRIAPEWNGAGHLAHSDGWRLGDCIRRVLDIAKAAPLLGSST